MRGLQLRGRLRINKSGAGAARMSKTLLYRLFGLGGIPQDAVDQIEKEGVVLQDEGIRGSVTFKRFRAPGKYYGWSGTGSAVQLY